MSISLARPRGDRESLSSPTVASLQLAVFKSYLQYLFGFVQITCGMLNCSCDDMEAVRFFDFNPTAILQNLLLAQIKLMDGNVCES